MTEARVVPVEIDATLHTSSPDPEAAETWAVLDTAYNLLRDHAVKETIKQMRAQALEDGHSFPEDELIFAQSAALGVSGYRDLAVNDPLAARGLMAVYEVLVKVTVENANDALGFGGGNH